MKKCIAEKLIKLRSFIYISWIKPCTPKKLKSKNMLWIYKFSYTIYVQYNEINTCLRVYTF